MRTGFAAVRVGIVMFTIPFVFAWYPELLLIQEAVTITDDSGQRALIDGYSGQADWGQLSMLLARLALALYLIASALSRFDKTAMSNYEVALRLLAAVLLLWKTPVVMFVGLALSAVILTLHYLKKDIRDETAPA